MAFSGHRGGRGGRGGARGGRGGASVQVFSSPRGIPEPNADVTKIENALEASTKSINLDKLSLVDRFPQRPGYGTSGSPVKLWANYVVLSVKPTLEPYRYNIAVSPEATGKKLTQIVRLCLAAPELAPHVKDIVTDFKATLISRKKLDNVILSIKYRFEDEDEARPNAKEYTVQISCVGSHDAARMIEYLTSTNMSAQYNDKLPMIQALNIFMNHYAKSSNKLTSLGSSKTFSLEQDAASWDLGDCLTAVRGFFTSVRAATARVLVNVNVSHAAFYQAGPLDQFIMRSSKGRNPYRLESFLKGIRITTTHLKEKKNKKGQVVLRVKTIHGLASKSDGKDLPHPPRVSAFGAGPKNVEFWMDAAPSKTPAKGGKPAAAKAGGKYISVYDFFSTEYKMKLTKPDLPVVNAGNRANPMYLPAEVCRVIPGQAARSKLDPNQTAQMIRFAVRSPWLNASSIADEGLGTVGLTTQSNPRLSEFGMTVSPDLITVRGRVLNGPKVVYRQNKAAQMVAGGWNMVPRDSPSLKFNAGGTVRKWSCLYVDMGSQYPDQVSLNSQGLNDILRRFTKVLAETGIVADAPFPPKRVPLQDTDDAELERQISGAANALQLLLVILPSTPIPLYNRIKQLCDVKYGIHTICCVGKKLAKEAGQDQYFRNIALKFNLKLGGSNQIIEPSRQGIIAEDKTMIVGIDVTHPSPGSSSAAPSIAGMVASVNKFLGQWPGVLSIQSKQRQEIVSSLTDMLKSRLRLWQTLGRHATLPENILVYRDGVSEGQYDLVLDAEVPLLRAACKEVYPSADQAKGLPRLSVIIVGKRHHTRFYPTQVSDADRSGNTKAGTVVDRGVTEARSWDFFLQSHTALQGTARPAHYFVVLDEIFRARAAASKKPKLPGSTQNLADELQDLTQTLCYTFGRATKAVSICTPAYYADILCERARCYLSHVFEASTQGSVAGSVDEMPSEQEVQVHARLKDTMFYI